MKKVLCKRKMVWKNRVITDNCLESEKYIYGYVIWQENFVEKIWKKDMEFSGNYWDTGNS